MCRPVFLCLSDRVRQKRRFSFCSDIGSGQRGLLRLGSTLVTEISSFKQFLTTCHSAVVLQGSLKSLKSYQLNLLVKSIRPLQPDLPVCFSRDWALEFFVTSSSSFPLFCRKLQRQSPCTFGRPLTSSCGYIVTQRRRERNIQAFSRNTQSQDVSWSPSILAN